MSDFATRYLLVCEALPTTQASFAFTVFERAFNDFGLPRMIRTDNGLSQKSRAQSFAELACCQI
jgi:putative transposase